MQRLSWSVSRPAAHTCCWLPLLNGPRLEFLCCGVGEPLPADAVRAAILLRANALARGMSAVRLEVLERLVGAAHACT